MLPGAKGGARSHKPLQLSDHRSHDGSMVARVVANLCPCLANAIHQHIMAEHQVVRVLRCRGRSCVGIGGGPIKCLQAQGWHKSAKRVWYCPACRQEYVDDDDWSPDWRALQNEVQCAREHHEAWTCSCDAPNWPWRTQCRRCRKYREQVEVPEGGGVAVPVPAD